MKKKGSKVDLTVVKMLVLNAKMKTSKTIYSHSTKN